MQPRRCATLNAVLRQILVAVFAIFLIQETNAGSLITGAECFETCPSDTTPGRCPLTCATCGCGTHLNPVPAAPMGLLSPPLREARLPVVALAAPSDRHTGDIRHVPKTVPA